MTYRGARLLTVLAIAGRDQTWLRRTARLHGNTIDRLLRDTGQRRAAAATLRRAAESAGVSAAWLNPPGAQRELSATESAELRRCLRVLRSIAGAVRIDARAVPNVRPEPARAVPPAFHAHGARNVYRVIGDSLVNAGVIAGDLAYVRPIDRLRDAVGALVVFRLNGRAYLKRLTVAARGVVTFSSAADGYEPIVIGADDELVLLGEVIAAVRECWRG